MQEDLQGNENIPIDLFLATMTLTMMMSPNADNMHGRT